jgi:drug/metabolite transporter (DMT)-like permease
MAVLGVGLLELDEGGSFDLTIGDLVSLIQPIAFGISYWRTEHVLEHYPEEANRITACELLSCFLFSFAFAIIVALANPEENAPTLGDWNEWLTSYQIWFALLWTGIMTTAVTLFLETIAMLSVGASETTLLISTEPLWAALFSWMILNESLGVLGIVGGLIIVGSCVLGMW